MSRQPRADWAFRSRTARLRWLAMAALLALCAGAASATPPASADRVERGVAGDVAWTLPGTFGGNTTLATLRERYGPSNVRVVELDGAEGETQRGIELFGSDPSRRLQLFMQDPVSLEGVSMARVMGTHSRWQLDRGVRLGMTLRELVARNGHPVTFNGMEWDYGGIVADWHQGALANAADAPVFRTVGLAAVDAAPEGSYPLGDGLFRSDDRAFPRQADVLQVTQISVSFAGAD